MKELSTLKSSKTLIIGAGSGRDMASAILVRERLRNNCPHVDLAGFLTPWALHSFDGKIEKPVNTIFNNPRKFIPLKEESPLGIFFEPLIEKYNVDYDLGIDGIFLFSLQYGTDILLKKIDELIRDQGYDLIVVVDVGGDILTRMKDIHTVLTPLVDLTCLHLLSEISHPVESYLAVIAPGVCGELPPHSLKDIMEEFEHDGFQVEKMVYTEESMEFKKYEQLNRAINSDLNAYSHTEKIINQVVRFEKNSNFKTTYRKKYRLLEREFVFPFEVEVEREFFNTIFVFELKQVKNARQDLMIPYQNVLEGFLKTRSNGTCGTEIDMSFIPTGFDENGYRQPVFLLTPCCYAKGDSRKAIIEAGCEQVKKNKIKYAVILRKDKGLIPTRFDVKRSDFGTHYCLLSDNKIEHNFLNYLNELC